MKQFPTNPIAKDRCKLFTSYSSRRDRNFQLIRSQRIGASC
ncbi:hypothetical protein NIES2104_56260 [Leptolyngbya sp. NIES-2104]|nr:hypothetical protein NIES2104_56260 [Leptolyngbya sp. NIES-2104]